MTDRQDKLEWDRRVVELSAQHMTTFPAESQSRLLAPLDATRTVDDRRAGLAKWRAEAVLELASRLAAGQVAPSDEWRDEVLAPMTAQLVGVGDDSMADWRLRIVAAVTTALEATRAIDRDDQDSWFVLADALASQASFVALINLSAAAVDDESVAMLRGTVSDRDWTELRQADLRRGIAISTALAIVAVVMTDERLEELAQRLDVLVVLTIYLHATLDVAIGTSRGY